MAHLHKLLNERSGTAQVATRRKLNNRCGAAGSAVEYSVLDFIPNIDQLFSFRDCGWARRAEVDGWGEDLNRNLGLSAMRNNTDDSYGDKV